MLITGGRRVGGELALMLADRGWNVAMTYRSSRDAIERTVAAVAERGRGGLAIPADLSRPEQSEQAVRQAATRFSRLDALVNMASLFRRTPFSSLTPRDFDDMIAANLAAPYHVAIAAARVMLAQPGEDGIKGRIVNIGDWATDRPYKDYLPYLVAKGGLTTMTLALAAELAPARPGRHDPAGDDRSAADPRSSGNPGRDRPDPPAADRLARRRQPPDRLLARRHELRHRRLLPG